MVPDPSQGLPRPVRGGRVAVGRWLLGARHEQSRPAPVSTKITAAASRTSRAGRTPVRARASAVPAIAPTPAPAPMKAKTRFAWETVKRSSASVQNRTTISVANSPLQR